MGLLRNAGRLVSQNRAVRAGAVGVVGLGALGAGMGSAVTDPEGLYQQQLIPDAQELAFGSRTAIQDSMRGGISAAMSGADQQNVLRNTDYYYSRPVNLRGNPDLGIPVSGELVFGMYNMRR